jgi:hypothetical protein
MKHTENSKGFNKTMKRLKKVNREIQDKKAEITEISTSLYYTYISNETHREMDLKEASSELKVLVSLKASILDSLEIEINLMKADLYTSLRKITLTVNNI